MNLENISTFGRKFIVEPAGTSLTNDERKLLQKLKPAGIMFRKRNFLVDQDYASWLSAYRNLVQQCKNAVGREKIIWCVDHEGGRVIRPPLPITPFAYAAHWAHQVEPVAQAMAVELKSLGINVNFAPVADIHSNPDNPVINERAFSSSVEAVTQATTRFAATMIKNGIIPCAKHFPGYGDVEQDPHYGLATANWNLDELRKRELLPFQALVDMGIPLIMTAHILLPKIDPDNQATTSKKILHDLLRKEMGFQQVIIADALGMQGIAGEFAAQETIAKALNAGLDLFLVAGDNTDLNWAICMAEHMQTAVENGSVSQMTIEASFNRIDKLLDELPQHTIEALDQKTFDQHAALAATLLKRQDQSEFKLHIPGFE